MATKILAKYLGAVAAATLLACVAISAKADSISFNLDTGNTNISGYTGPYESVTVNLTSSTTATITFNSLSNANYIFLMGDGGSAGVNVNGDFTLGTITGTGLAGFTSPPPYSDGGSGNVNGFGLFDLTINSFDGFTHSSNQISFNLTADNGNTWATPSDVLEKNANGALAVAHVFVCAQTATVPCTTSTGTAATGFAAGGGNGSPPPEEIPEPGSLALAGLGLLAAAAMRRRKQ